MPILQILQNLKYSSNFTFHFQLSKLTGRNINCNLISTKQSQAGLKRLETLLLIQMSLWIHTERHISNCSIFVSKRLVWCWWLPGTLTPQAFKYSGVIGISVKQRAGWVSENVANKDHNHFQSIFIIPMWNVFIFHSLKNLLN